MSTDPAAGDRSTRGFLATEPDPLRYDASTRDRWEGTGMICDRIPSGSRVLDIGCGTGSISSLIVAECNADLVGVEPDARRAEVCRARGLHVERGYYDQAMAERLGDFDVILFADVLEHVSDPASLLELAARHLNPRGVIVATVPNVVHWTVRFAMLRGRFDYEPFGIMDATHLRWFTTRTLRQLFAAVGLEIVDHDWTNGAWMSVYRSVPAPLLGRLLRGAVRALPGFFACQHVVTAVNRHRGSV